MKLPKLLNADFEQSLNLLDDSLVESYKEWWDEHEPNRFGIIGNSIGFLLLLSGIWVCPALSWAVCHLGDNTGRVNLFPFWLTWVIIAVFLLLAFGQVYAMRQNWKQMEYYNSQTLLFWYFLTLLLSMNLCGATLLMPVVTMNGVVIGSVAVVGSSIVVLRKKTKKMIVTLYDFEEEIGHRSKWLDKILNFKVIVSLGSVFLVGYYIYKNTFWHFGTGVTALSVIGSWVAINIVMFLMVVYLFFPSIIEGYYRNKYAEEYRDWEGKTQIEWYGEKYFNKHIKGTEKEKKE